jgi:putative oxidoreductase
MKAHTWVTAARVLLGAAFLLFGVDGFVHWLTIPPARPEAARLIGALIASGYFFQMVKLIEIGVGALLLCNRWVPFSLVTLAPVLVGITSIHLFLNPGGLPLMLLLCFLYGVLVAGYWPYLSPLLVKRAAVLLGQPPSNSASRG